MVEYENVAIGQSTKTAQMPLTMAVYGQSACNGTRMANFTTCCYGYNHNVSTTYTIGFHNNTNETKSCHVFCILIGMI